MGLIAAEQELEDYAIDYVLHMTDCLMLVAAKYQDVTIPNTPDPDHIDCVETKCETTNYLITCDHVQCNVCVPSVTGCLSALIALTGSNTPPRLLWSRWEVRAKMLGSRGSTFASCLPSINRRVIQQRRSK